jgi:hypothetical protein
VFCPTGASERIDVGIKVTGDETKVLVVVGGCVPKKPGVGKPVPICRFDGVAVV